MSKTRQTKNLNFEKIIVSVLSSTTQQNPKIIRQLLNETLQSTIPQCDTGTSITTVTV
jgi:hypothetical protein